MPRLSLDEHPEATIEEAGLVASCLAALPGASYKEAVRTLRGMSETATSRRRESGVARSQGSGRELQAWPLHEAWRRTVRASRSASRYPCTRFATARRPCDSAQGAQASETGA